MAAEKQAANIALKSQKKRLLYLPRTMMVVVTAIQVDMCCVVKGRVPAMGREVAGVEE